jgi:AraC family transcriptional regulator
MTASTHEETRPSTRRLAGRRFDGLTLGEIAYERGFTFLRHWHSNARLVFTIAGTYEETFGRRRRTCVPSSMVVRPPGEEHEQEYHAETAVAISVDLPPAWSDRLCDRTDVLSRSGEYRGSRFGRIAATLHTELRRPDAAAELAIEAAILEAAVEAARGGPWEGAGPPRWLARARDFVHARYDEPFRVADVAREADVHPTHLARVFRKHVGCSVGEYVRRLRVEHARDLLTTTDRPLVDVAIQAGVADQSHFSKVFKRVAGATPAEFRALHRQR